MKKLSIKLYLQLIAAATFLFILVIAWGFYHSHRDRAAALIIDDIRANLFEQSFKLSKGMASLEGLNRFSAELQRVAASHGILDAFLIADQQRVLFSTDARYRELPAGNDFFRDVRHITIDDLLNILYYRQSFTFLENNQQRELFLFLIIDSDEIGGLLEEEFNHFLFLLLVVGAGVLLVQSLIHHYLIVLPLEKLRQYAYYQSDIPDEIRIREMEYIRASMKQSFTRLEQEKQQLYDISRTDQLSGLSNRNSLQERIDWLIADSKRINKEFAFFFLDLDHFKSVNDWLGHDVGDELLKQIALYIKQLVRAGDITARIGGDEFVIVISRYDSLLDLVYIINRIISFIKEPFLIDGHSLYVSASIGVCMFPKDGDNLTALLKHADIAMYEAKRLGRDQFHFFTEELNDAIQMDMALENDLRGAVERKEFVLFYQPKVDVQSGAVVGAEALIRWNHPIKGMVPPDQFIPHCEKNGMIIEIGDWVLREAMEQQVRWKQAGICDIKISVNVAALQFQERNFESKLRSKIKSSGVKPEKVDLEITEYLFLAQTEKTLSIMRSLMSLGVSVSLDDFGTGYSSLSYLKRFPVSTIKIDKSFLNDYATHNGAAFIEMIVQIGRSLGMNVIAEGVEEEEQVAYLKAVDCDQYQGYFFSKPVAAEEFENLI